MNKSLKKCYHYLDLPYNATEEDVITRENALIKILKAKETKNKVSYEEKINRVMSSANLIIENIKTNGIPNVKPHWFETSNESLFIQIAILCFVGVLCLASFIIFL